MIVDSITVANQIGIAIAACGAILSCVGAYHNNINLDHTKAMRFWEYSNPIMLVWAAGFSIGIWTAGLSGIALIAIYAMFTFTNRRGLKMKTMKSGVVSIGNDESYRPR